MSLRFTGNQAIRTANTTFLDGVSTFSFSLWLKQNTDAVSYGTYFFTQNGETSTAAAVFFIAPWNLKGLVNCNFSFNSAGVNNGSNFEFYITPYQVYHMAVVGGGGSISFYLNGYLYGTVPFSGGLGPIGGITPAPLSIGSDSLGFEGFTPFDVTIDEPTIWSGHMLTSSEIFALRDRTLAPAEIAPGNLIWHLPFNGAPGTAAALGDAAITDTSASGLSAAAIVGSGTATYDVPLTYTPVASIGSAVVAPSRQGIMLVIEDQQGNPANVAPVGNPTIVATGGGGTGFGAYPLVGVPLKETGTNQIYALTLLADTENSFKLFVQDQWQWVAMGQTPAAMASTLASTLAYLMYLAAGVPCSASDFTITYTTAGATTTYTIEYSGDSVSWEDWSSLAPLVFDGSTLPLEVTTLLVVDDADTGFSTTGSGWTNFPETGPLGDNILYMNYPNTGTATWNFTGLTPGTTYTASVSWMPYAYRNTNCLYRIYDASNPDPVVSTSLDQTATPAGGPDLKDASHASSTTASTVPSAVVGSFTASGTTARVVVDSSSPINPVIGTLGSTTSTTADACGLSCGTSGSSLTVVQEGQSPSQWTSQAGQVTGAIIYSAGGGYTSAPTLTVQGGFGSGASLTASVSGGQVVGISVAEGGSGYAIGTYTINGTSYPLPAPFYWSGANAGNVGSNPPSSPYIYFPLLSPIASDASVTLTTYEGSIFVAAGAVGKVTGMEVANTGATSQLSDTLPSSTTLGVGYNISSPQLSTCVSQYANRCKNTTGFYPVGGGTAVYDVNNYPTTASTATLFQTIVAQTSSTGLDARGFANMPLSGVWTLMWDGNVDASLIQSDVSGTVTLVASHTGNATGNWKTYQVNVVSEYHNATTIYMNVAPGIQNVQVYQPGIDTTNPPKFDPNYLRMLAGAKSFRFMDAANANNLGLVEYADYTNPDSFYYQTYQTTGGVVASIGPRLNPDAYYAGYIPVLVTFSSPHGMKNGQLVTFSTGGNGGPHGNDTFDTVQGPVSASINDNHLVRVESPTTISFPLGGSGTLATTYTGSQIGPAPTCTGQVGYGMPIADMVALCNAVGADMWFNSTSCISDSGVTQIFTYIAENLDSNLKCRYEYSNEHWNSFPCHAWFEFMGLLQPMIVAFNIVSGGSGYTSVPAITITGGGGTGATATAVLTNGAISNLVVTNPGTGYTSPPTVTVTGGGGTGANIAAYVGSFDAGFFYTLRASQVHALARAAFVAAGRPATDLVRVMGTQFGDSDVTTAICRYAAAFGIQFDELASAPYYDNAPNGAVFDPANLQVGDQLNYQQNMDVAEYNMKFGNYGDLFAQHRASLDAAGFTNVDQVCYEGGGAFGFSYYVGTNRRSNDRYARERSLSTALDPRAYGVVLSYLSQLDAAGIKVFNHYTSAGINGLVGGINWVEFRRWDQPLARGDGSDGQYDNRTDYDDQLNIVAVRAKAYADWNATLGTTPPSPPPSPPAPPAGQSGLAKKFVPRSPGSSPNSLPFQTHSRPSVRTFR